MTLALPSRAGLAPTGRAPFRSAGYNSGLFPANEETAHARKLFVAGDLPLQTDFKSTNVLFWGRRGKGKTLSMVALSKLLAPGFKQAGWRVQANINVDFSDIGIRVNCHPLLGLFVADDMARAERSLIDFDELTEIVPSRAAMTKANRSSLSVMVQIRKLMCEVMTTTQFPTSIDKQMLQQIDLFVLCDAWIPKDARWNRYSAARAFVKLYIFDLWGQFTGNFQASKYFPPPLWMAMKVMYLRNLPASWNSYKTNQLVVSAHAKEDVQERMIGRQWDMDSLERMEEDAYERSMQSDPAAMKEWAAVEAARQTEGYAGHAPPPVEHVSLTPQSLEAWMRQRRAGGRFRVTNAMIKEFRAFGHPVVSLEDVMRLLQGNGFEVFKSDNGIWNAEVVR